MSRQTTAEIRFSLPVGKRPTGRFFAHGKLPSDGSKHPFGQWSVVIEPVFESDQADVIMAFVAFVVPDAPHEELKRGTRLELFYGPNRVGTALITTAQSVDKDGLPSDRDFLAGQKEAA